MRTPDELSKSGTEHGHQVAVFAYCSVVRLVGWQMAAMWSQGEVTFKKGEPAYAVGIDPLDKKPVKELEWFHAVHNQGHGDAIRGNHARAEGVRSGVHDCFLPLPRQLPALNEVQWFHGLYIEMKKPSIKPKRATSIGGLSKDQIEFKNYAERQGYAVAVCYDWREAVNALYMYINNPTSYIR